MFSSVLTFACYLTLVGRIGAGKAGYATVIFPVFALLISTVFEKYQWGVLPFAGICLVVAKYTDAAQPLGCRLVLRFEAGSKTGFNISSPRRFRARANSDIPL